jgi:tape measure domain-containing protein
VSTDVELRLSADVDKATRDVGKFRREYVDLVREVERPLRQVNAFRSLENDLEGTQRQMRQARDRVRELGQALASAANPSRAMQAEYRDAVSELTKLERAEGALTAQLARRRDELQAAGIDTRNLANEQTRLSTALTSAVQQGNADLANTNARKALGVGAIEETQRELVQLRQQYRLVTSSGELSAKERSEAEANYRRSVSQTLERLRDLREANRQATESGAEQAITLAQRQEQARIGIRRVTAEQKQQAIAARQAAIETARNDLGVTRYRALEAELQQIRLQYELLRRTGNLTTRELAIAQANMTQRVRETKRAMRELGREQAGIGSSRLGGFGLFGGATAAYASFNALRGIARISDAYAGMDARLKLVTDSQEEFNTAQQELRRIADRNQAPLESLVTLYTRIAPALREAGRSQRDIIGLTEVVSATFRISGATSEEATNGVIQFAQALGAGALRGDEFNSVAEQAPRLMQALADGLGVPVTALRDLAKEGELTASRVTEALLSQSEIIKEEAAQLPETVGGAMTRLANAWNDGVAQTNLQPLIDSIDKLREQVSDPEFVNNLAIFAGWLVKIGGWGLDAAAEVGDLFDRFTRLAQDGTGVAAELQKVDQQLKDIERSLNGTGMNATLAGIWYSDEELKEQRAALRQHREELLAEQTGMNSEQALLAEVAAAVQEKAAEQAAAARRAYVDAVNEARNEELEAAKASLKALVSEEKKANSELDKIRKARLEIEKSYREALDKIGGAGAEGASYGAAQQLKVDAREALQRGDFEEAQRQARAARDMLVELAEAGENTYGFEGFIKELEQIDLAANKLQENKAADELQRIQSEMEALKAKTEELKDMEVSVKLDDASLEAVRNQLAEFAKTVNGTQLTIPVRTVYSDGSIDVTDIYNDFKAGNKPPGFARGGWTGPGSKYQIAGVVHADEYVQPKYRMREPGALAFMEAFRRHGMSILRNGYAEGGLVSMPRNIPFIPPMPASAGAGSLGTATLNLMLADQQYTLQGDSGTIEALLKAGKRYGLKKG